MPRDELRFALPGPTPVVRERHLLLCSPDPDLTVTLCDALSARGYLVESVASAAEAIAAIGHHAPDLLLCDDAPPSLDAMALLHRLRGTDQPAQPMPVIVLSSFDSPADIAAGRNAGADDFLAKPADMGLLESSIHAQLRLVDRVRAALAPQSAGRAGTVEGVEWAALVDRLSIGVIISDRGGRTLHANTAARHLAGGSQTRLRSWARPRSPAADGASADGVTAVRILPPTSAPGAPQSPLVVTHLDLRRSDPNASCLVTLLFSPDGPDHGTRLMAAALGLTPAETLVANCLVTGKRREQIAEIMSVTMPTVNYHLRNIYQKSGTSRQSDAVRLLRSVPLASHASAGVPTGRA